MNECFFSRLTLKMSVSRAYSNDAAENIGDLSRKAAIDFARDRLKERRLDVKSLA